MLQNFFPTLEAPDNNSPLWYQSYHSSFYMSQLVNNVLLSYMISFIKDVQLEKIILANEEELTKKGIIEKTDFLGEPLISVDFERIYAIDIEDFLNQLIIDFQKKASSFHNDLLCSGIAIRSDNDKKSYMDRTVAINLKNIAASAGNKNWFDIVKGFLNVWEFLFLFSITESTLKKIANDKSTVRELIKNINLKYPDIQKHLEKNHNINNTFATDTWSIFVSVRNIYSHTHGMISEKNKRDITREAMAFRKSYSEYRKSFMLFIMKEEVDKFFESKNIKVGSFYFLADHELNVFRNFVSEYMFILSKTVKD